MHSPNVWLLLAIFGGLCRYGQATCVLESDFGFVINCAFKKSGLFRVRNLGGVKAHIGLGFSLGDELGFKQSFSNTEGNRRRSAAASPFIAQAALLQQRAQELKLNETRPSVNSLPHAVAVPSAKKMNTANNSKVQSMNIPPFKPIPPAPERPIVPKASSPNGSSTVRLRTKSKDPQHPPPMSMGVAVPTFNSMPSSISRISHGETVLGTKEKSPPQIAILMPVKKGSGDKMSNTFALRTLATEQDGKSQINIRRASSTYEVQNMIVNSNASNLEEAIAQGGLDANAIMNMNANGATVDAAPASTRTTTTVAPPKSKYHKHATYGKVMNAPKEYYPVGYDKNFDDNFSSRVDLPETSFRCGDQKHFPGLYGDEDLGCMVFHVCALTDDGLIMKSFLCPESTLFDQTILKCNWWFYVDCKNSKKLYDSNIPISKSYQLMKALTFFSSYNKDSRSNQGNRQTVKSTTASNTVTKE